MTTTSLQGRMFAIGRNITGIKTSVAVWAEGDHEGTGRGAWIEWGYNPNSGLHPFNPPIGEWFEGTYTLEEVRELCPGLAP